MWEELIGFWPELHSLKLKKACPVPGRCEAIQRPHQQGGPREDVRLWDQWLLGGFCGQDDGCWLQALHGREWFPCHPGSGATAGVQERVCPGVNCQGPELPDTLNFLWPVPSLLNSPSLFLLFTVPQSVYSPRFLGHHGSDSWGLCWCCLALIVLKGPLLPQVVPPCKAGFGPSPPRPGPALASVSTSCEEVGQGELWPLSLGRGGHNPAEGALPGSCPALQLGMVLMPPRPILQPERINPELNQKGYNVKSDVWSLGITMVRAVGL